MQKNVLKGKIAEAGLSQRMLAKKLNMSVNSLNSKINGRTSFNCDEAIAICDVLHIVDNAERANIFLH